MKVALVFLGQEIDSMTWDLEAFHKPRAAIGILRPGDLAGAFFMCFSWENMGNSSISVIYRYL